MNETDLYLWLLRIGGRVISCRACRHLTCASTEDRAHEMFGRHTYETHKINRA